MAIMTEESERQLVLSSEKIKEKVSIKFCYHFLTVKHIKDRTLI